KPTPADSTLLEGNV
ncbi:hypothetical protein NPIL_255761, partial [Nephila pilipes]